MAITCSIDECAEPAKAKGMCPRHYQRVRKSGHPTIVRRECAECGTAFTYEAKNGRRHAFCADCVTEHVRRHSARYNRRQSLAAENEPEFYVRLRAYRFRSNIRRYGITPEQYDALLSTQGGLCAICGDAPDANGKGAYARLHIDHDHATGLVRGLLCGRCNQGLGYFRDSPDSLASAIKYLKKAKEHP